MQLPQEDLPLSGSVPPRVDFVDDGSDVYPKAVERLREPEVEPDPEIKQFLHEAAIRGSVDAVYGVGKQYLKTDIQKAISMFELAAEQGSSYAEYQLGKIYCFGQGVPQNLEVGMEWLKASASHGNEYAAHGNRKFWCTGYFVSTVGKNEKKIAEYVRNQLQEDYVQDQMCIKEYIDPFTGEPVGKSK